MTRAETGHSKTGLGRTGMAVLKIFWRLRSAAGYFIEVLIRGPDGGESQESDRTKSSCNIEAAHC